jgi:hypothetical protein
VWFLSIVKKPSALLGFVRISQIAFIQKIYLKDLLCAGEYG